MKKKIYSLKFVRNCHGHNLKMSRAFLIFSKIVTGILPMSREEICQFCHGQKQKCHGHFFAQKMSRAFFVRHGHVFQKCHGHQKKCHGQKIKH